MHDAEQLQERLRRTEANLRAVTDVRDELFRELERMQGMSIWQFIVWRWKRWA